MKLNKIERLKTNLKPIDYLSRLEHLDFANLEESDRFYLKNFGIYTQSQRANEFMLRLRIAGGRVTLMQLEAIWEIAKAFDAKLLITARAQIELQKLTPQNILQVYKRAQESGLSSWQTLTDNFRNIITDVYDGYLNDSLIECYPLILQMQELFLGRDEYVGMIPRKFNTAIIGNVWVYDSYFGNDCLFALAKKDSQVGFNLYLGGKNNEVAQDMDIFVPKEQVVALFAAVIKSYLVHGNRASRTKARFYFLLKSLGVAKLRAILQEESGFKLQSRGELLFQKESMDDFTRLRDGNYGYRFKSRYGEINWKSLAEIIQFAKKSSLEIRLGIDQNIYLLGLKEPEAPFEGLSENQNLLVCAGSRYCFFSLFDTKAEAGVLDLTKINRYKIKVGYSGCLKGCGRHYFSDIGFVGIRTNLYGKVEFGVRLFLGGLYTQGERGARLIYWAVPLRALNSLLAIIVEEFEMSGYRTFEEFSKKVLVKFESEFLAFWFLAKLYTKKRVTLKEQRAFDYLISGEHAIVGASSEDKERLYETIKELERRLYGRDSS